MTRFTFNTEKIPTHPGSTTRYSYPSGGRIDERAIGKIMTPAFGGAIVRSLTEGARAGRQKGTPYLEMEPQQLRGYLRSTNSEAQAANALAARHGAAVLQYFNNEGHLQGKSARDIVEIAVPSGNDSAVNRLLRAAEVVIEARVGNYGGGASDIGFQQLATIASFAGYAVRAMASTSLIAHLAKNSGTRRNSWAAGSDIANAMRGYAQERPADALFDQLDGITWLLDNGYILDSGAATAAPTASTEPATTANPTPTTETLNPMTTTTENPGAVLAQMIDQAASNAASQAVAANAEAVEQAVAKKVRETIDQLTESGLLGGTKKIEVTRPNLPTLEIEEAAHEKLEEVIQLATARENILLVGPTGTGKTHLCAQAAKALELTFRTVSCTAGVTEGALVGRYLPTGAGGAFEWHDGPFTQCYEQGGVFLLDEADSADPNTVLRLNAALSNGFLDLERGRIEQSPDFIFIASANTWMHGYDRNHTGRQAQDLAFTARFNAGKVLVEYDRKMEGAIVPDPELLATFWGMRDRAKQHHMENRQPSTRTIRSAANMKAHGWTMERILANIAADWTEDERTAILPQGGAK